VADPVQLTDLDVIARYSIAVRRASADRSELIETLRADLAWLESGRRRALDTVVEPGSSVEPDPEPSTGPDAPPAEAPLRRMPVTVKPPKPPATKKAASRTATAGKKTAGKKTAAKQAAGKKAAAKRSPAKRATSRR
jgi:hypothetical protein